MKHYDHLNDQGVMTAAGKEKGNVGAGPVRFSFLIRPCRLPPNVWSSDEQRPQHPGACWKGRAALETHRPTPATSPAPGIISGSLSLRSRASGLRGSTQKTDRSARAYTDVHDELGGQLVRQAGDCGPSFLQKNPADRAEETVHTSTMAWPETASQLSAAHRVKRLPVGTQPMGRTGAHGMTMPPSDLFRTL